MYVPTLMCPHCLRERDQSCHAKCRHFGRPPVRGRCVLQKGQFDGNTIILPLGKDYPRAIGLPTAIWVWWYEHWYGNIYKFVKFSKRPAGVEPDDDALILP